MIYGEHPIFANILVGAKHFGSKSLVITNKLSAEMLRPFQIEMHPIYALQRAFIEEHSQRENSFMKPEQLDLLRIPQIPDLLKKLGI